MSVNLEVTQGVLRLFDGDSTYEQSDPFVGVATVTWIGRDAVLISAELGTRKLTQGDARELKQCLKDHHIAIAYCWHRSGYKLPLPGKIIGESGNLFLWEMTID
jgi:hypothetical protein